jgi:putative endonuclease
MNNNYLGRHGENLATTWLTRNGYKILLRNWKFGRYEIDIVAEKENCMHAIEVKTRKSNKYGSPENSVSPSKQKNIVAASAALMEEKGYEVLQVDVLAITIRNRAVDYFFIEDICGCEL